MPAEGPSPGHRSGRAGIERRRRAAREVGIRGAGAAVVGAGAVGWGCAARARRSSRRARRPAAAHPFGAVAWARLLTTGSRTSRRLGRVRTGVEPRSSSRGRGPGPIRPRGVVRRTPSREAARLWPLTSAAAGPGPVGRSVAGQSARGCRRRKGMRRGTPAAVDDHWCDRSSVALGTSARRRARPSRGSRAGQPHRRTRRPKEFNGDARMSKRCRG